MKKLIFALLFISSASFAQTVTIPHGGTGMSTAGVTLNADTAITGQALVRTPLQFTTTANQRYYISGHIYATSSTAAGIKLGVRIPTGDSCYVIFEGTDTTVLQSSRAAVAADSGLTTAFVQLNGTGFITFSGIVSGPTAGPVAIGILKLTSGTATFKQWSGMIWRRLY